MFAAEIKLRRTYDLKAQLRFEDALRRQSKLVVNAPRENEDHELIRT